MTRKPPKAFKPHFRVKHGQFLQLKKLFYHNKVPSGGFLIHSVTAEKNPLSISTFHLVLKEIMTTSRKHHDESTMTLMARRPWQKLVWTVYLFENKYSTSHLPQLSPSTNSEGFTRGVGLKASRERLLLVFNDVNLKNVESLLANVFKQLKEGGAGFVVRVPIGQKCMPVTKQ